VRTFGTRFANCQRMNEPRCRGLARRVFAVLTVLALASCTALKLGYDHADSLIVSSLDRYLDLTERQEDLVRSRARSLLAWHRQSQLPDYVSFIGAVRERIGRHFTPDDVLTVDEGIDRRLLRLGDQAAPDLAELALTLTPSQIDRLERKMADDTARIRREFAGSDGDRAATRRMRRFIERTEGWFGDLRHDQLQLVHESPLGLPSRASWSIETRTRRQADLVRLLRRVNAEHPDAATVAVWLRHYFDRLAHPVDAQEQAHAREFRRDSAELVAALLNSADADQRSSINSRLAGYADDFRALAREHRSD